MIGRSGERGSRISVLAARHDDDDDIYICVCVCVLFGRVKPELGGNLEMVRKIYKLHYLVVLVITYLKIAPDNNI